MTLYHYTTASHLEEIKVRGLTRGVIPITMTQYHHDYQWLTSNKDWFPPWAAGLAGKYARTQYRIEVQIPKKAKRNLLSWSEHGTRLVPLVMWDMLNSHDNPNDWYVFDGRIPASWFGKIEQRPGGLIIPTMMANEEAR